jgi:hypothetical protein
MQHDCCEGKCIIDTTTGRLRREREDQALPVPLLVHNASPFYLLNTCLQRSAWFARILYPDLDAAPTPEEIARTAKQAVEAGVEEPDLEEMGEGGRFQGLVDDEDVDIDAVAA